MVSPALPDEKTEVAGARVPVVRGKENPGGISMKIKVALVLALLLLMPWGRGQCDIPDRVPGSMSGFRLAVEAGVGDREIDLGSDYEVDAEREFVLLRASYPVSANVGVYVTGGICSLDIDHPFGDLPFSVEGFRGDQGIAWGFGATMVIVETPDIMVSAGADFLSFASDASQGLGSPLSVTGVVEGDARWQEISLMARGAYTGYDRWMPYGGVSLSLVDGEVEMKERIGDLEGEEAHDFDGKDLFGVFLGVEYDVWANLAVGAEVGLLSETKISLRATWMS